MNSNIQFENGLIKIIGVFAFNKNIDFQRFQKIGYTTQPLVLVPDNLPKDQLISAIEETESIYKNVYYKEFRGLILDGQTITDYTGNEKENVKVLHFKKFSENLLFNSRFNAENSCAAEIQNPEILLFPNGIGLFSITLSPKDWAAVTVSNLLYLSRDFNTKVTSNNNHLEWHAWISKNILGGIELAGNNVHTDEFSGSKFKTYSILNLDESKLEAAHYNRDHLLYEIATCSKLGSIEQNGYDSPAEDFYQSIMQQKFSAFNNYTGITILDSFTVIGNGHFAPLQHDFRKFRNWNKIYFSIYTFNLYIKYNLFKFNTEFLKDPVQYRDQFQKFINDYNFQQIAFNFLPNLIFKNIRTGLEIEQDIEYFEKRLTSLANQIQEEQEKRQAALLGFISIISAVDAIDSITASIANVQAFTGLSSLSFFIIASIVVVPVCLGILRFLFPHQFNKQKKETF